MQQSNSVNKEDSSNYSKEQMFSLTLTYMTGKMVKEMDMTQNSHSQGDV